MTVPPDPAWTAWTFDAGVLVGLAGMAVAQAHAVRQAWARAGRGTAATPHRVVVFGLGVVVLVVALVSPLDAVAEQLFAAHMVQHLLLLVVAAPLLVAGRVQLGLRALAPVRVRRRTARWWATTVGRRAPLGLAMATLVEIAVVVAWHVPGPYELALAEPTVHALEHLTLLAAAVPFWISVGAGRRRPVPAAALAAFAVSLSFVLLAAAMTAATGPWYDSHLATTAAWGLTPLEDQQLAAAIMWVPGGLVHLAAAAAAVVRWLRADEQAHAARA